jgi:hypothetical protein
MLKSFQQLAETKKVLKFYGMDGNFLKLEDTVFEVVADENDGYRSSMDDVRAVASPPKNLVFFRRALDTVRVVAVDAHELDGFRLVSTKDGHVWAEVGTDYSEDYYPCFISRYLPLAPVDERSCRDVAAAAEREAEAEAEAAARKASVLAGVAADKAFATKQVAQEQKYPKWVPPIHPQAHAWVPEPYYYTGPGSNGEGSPTCGECGYHHDDHIHKISPA